VGWNVRRIRTEKTITIEELADRAEIDSSYLAKIERGTVNPSIGKLASVAKALGVKLADLVVEPAPGSRAPKPLPAGRRPA